MPRLGDLLLSVLYPPRCAACDALLGDEADPVRASFCPGCEPALEPLPSHACPRCADPGRAPQGRCCAACRHRPPAFLRVHAPWLFGGPLLEAVHAFKYGPRPWLARPLGRLLAASLPPALVAPDLVIPVPLHPTRLRARGFDQAERLSVWVAGRWGLDPAGRLLARVRPTAPQVGQGRAARARNLAGAFVVRPGSGRRLRGRRVLLVDDVLTTGATASAAARALLEAGAAAVEIAVLARAE